MTSLLIDGLSWACLLAGGLFCCIGALGLLRMPDFYTRMHAGSVTDTLGAGLVLLGLMLQAGLTLVTVKLVMIGLLLFFSSPAAGHALAKAAISRGLKPLLADSDDTSPTSPPLATDEFGVSVDLENAPSKP
ncbi:monovalent cation/H(+) antiporter subunit G [Accumulibacter sp.]|uniref:monovalent cation/H(+) antiporter subunit G n=1 Tax=Accumulibacter sp. TaxID=2053492 RepID=UPI0028C3DF4F|nr:monovalent cation/H(+) antiporter subunit G [Accumulibacter sp.]